MEYDAGLWACHSKVTFPQNKGRATKKEKGSPQIREVYLQSLNQHSEEVKWEVEEMLKVLDVFRRHRKKKRQNVKVSRVLAGSVSTDCLVKEVSWRTKEKIK